ncbi:MAG TPA: hypothetical protein VF756_32190 [Thermoanaerobaculia bacterium]
MKIVVLVLALTLSAFGGAPAWLTQLWNGSAADEGCGWDPNGCPVQSGPDEGCGMDPDGCSNALQPTSDEGCGADPNGCAKS